ncbi:ATP-dependent helicase C-terminal domain-containing protein [Kocuria rhizophila]|nr:ATP-dependent helicase C-terminal domain-containing protein [Kocuria rhizophila]
MAELTRAAGRAAAGTGAVVRRGTPGPDARAAGRGSARPHRDARELLERARQPGGAGGGHPAASPPRLCRATRTPPCPPSARRSAAEGLDLLPGTTPPVGCAPALPCCVVTWGSRRPAVDDAAARRAGVASRCGTWPAAGSCALRCASRTPCAGCCRGRGRPPGRTGPAAAGRARREHRRGSTTRRSGTRRNPNNRPWLAVKLQEVLGWAETPARGGRCVPVQFHLPSPGKATPAITSASPSSGRTPRCARRRARYPAPLARQPR